MTWERCEDIITCHDSIENKHTAYIKWSFGFILDYRPEFQILVCINSFLYKSTQIIIKIIY